MEIEEILNNIRERHNYRADHGVKGMRWKHHKSQVEDVARRGVSIKGYEKNGSGKRFTETGRKSAKSSFDLTNSEYRSKRNKLVEKLKDKPDGTYDPDTGESLEFDDGYQVAFQTSISEDLRDGGYVSDSEYDKLCERISKEAGSKAFVGKFDVPETSFRCKTFKQAMDIAKEFNQQCIMDWKKFQELRNGDWSPEDQKLMFPENPYYDSGKNHVKGE